MDCCFQRGDNYLRALKWYKSLSDFRKRNEEGFFLLEGFKAVQQVIKCTPGSIDELVVTEKIFSELIKEAKFPVRIISESQFKVISSSKTPQGILAVVKIPHNSYCPELPDRIGLKVLFLEHIQDPGNVGTLIRTAVAFGFSGVILSRQCADPFSSKVLQATAGSVLNLWIRRTEKYAECLEKLKSSGFKIFAADIRGKSHIDFSSESKQVVVLGNEGGGITEPLLKKADVRFRIPFDSQKIESLNVAVSGSVAMFCMSQGIGW